MDSLVVTLGLDTTLFDKGIKDVDAELKRLREGVTKTTVDIQTTGKKTVETFSGMKIGVLEMAAALMGAIKLLEQFRGTAENLRAIGVAARNIGISVQDLTAFRNAVEANGGNADQASASFQHLADAMARFALTGKTELLPFLNEIGGTIGDNAMQIYMKFVEWASRQGGNIQRIRLIGQGLGLDEGSIQLALKGVAGVRKELEEARRRGLPTDEEVKNMTELSRAFRELEQAVASVWRRLANDFAPTLTAILNTVKELIVQNPKMADSLFAIAGALGVIAALKLPGWLLRGLGGGAAAGAAAGGAGAAAASGGFWGFLRRWGPLALLAFTGPAGSPAGDANTPGTQAYAEKLAREKWEREHPGQRAAGSFWEVLGRFFGIRSGTQAPAPSSMPPGGAGTRGMRNNNPLNLSYVPGQGAIGSDGRFGQYATMEGGIAASHRQLLRYQDRGLNTLERIIATWAPPSENDTEAYIRQVSAWTGFRRDQVLDMRDPATAHAVISAMARMESGAVDPEVVRRGIAESQRQQGVPAAAVAPAPQALQRSAIGGNGPLASAAPSFSIGQLTVVTQATDAPGIARDIGAELRKVATITQANRGLA